MAAKVKTLFVVLLSLLVTLAVLLFVENRYLNPFDKLRVDGFDKLTINPASERRPQSLAPVRLKVGEIELTVEVADTPPKRALGLSFRDSLGLDAGLLFIFETPGFYPFWMKDMRFPLDIIWLDENFKVVDFYQNISPQTFPNTFVSKEAAKYVLEINAGFIDNSNVEAGDSIDVLEQVKN